jgi:chromosomal replication initiation ATPase DnaA
MIAQDIEKHMAFAGLQIATIPYGPHFSKRHIQHIIAVTANVTGQPMANIVGRDRYLPLVKARSIIARLARGPYSLTLTGQALNRHHTTILNLLRSFEGFYATDKDFQQCYKQVLYKL